MTVKVCQELKSPMRWTTCVTPEHSKMRITEVYSINWVASLKQTLIYINIV